MGEGSSPFSGTNTIGDRLSSYDDPVNKIMGGLGCGVLIFVLFVVGFLFSFQVVNPGEVGVVVTTGKADNEEKAPGISFVVPFISDVISVDTRIQGIPFEKLGAASKEYQDVFLTGTLNVHVQPDRASELYQQVGLDYKDKLVIPFYANIVKEIVPQYPISEVLPKREEIRRLTVEKLQAKLSPYGIIVDDVALTQIDFNEQYNAAIQDKQVQQLRVETERNILEQKKIQKQQQIVQAEADAEVQIEKARGEAESNRLISESLTEEILQNRYIEKLSDNIQVMMVPGGGEFIFDTKGLINPQPTAQP